MPLSVSPRVRPQAIIPTPVQQYNVIGATYVQLTAYSTSGVAQVLESAAIPVLDNCSF